MPSDLSNAEWRCGNPNIVGQPLRLPRQAVRLPYNGFAPGGFEFRPRLEDLRVRIRQGTSGNFGLTIVLFGLSIIEMRSAAVRFELDSMIADIELTLVSIIQGVAFTVLIDNARVVVAKFEFTAWPYVIAGLLVILVFWSRAVLHIITVIRWPLEFGHNFLYIACALVEAISFSQLTQPARWFGFGAAFIAAGWMLFAYDLRLIRARMGDNTGEVSRRLYAMVARDQWFNLGLLLPAIFLINVACAAAIQTWPQFFLLRNGHIWLVIIQLGAFAGYLLYVTKFYTRLAPLILQARAEWRADSEQA